MNVKYIILHYINYVTMKIKDLKAGDYFTIKNIEFPSENQVWVREDYDRSAKKYWAHKFSNVSDGRLFDGKKEVFTDFEF